MTTRKDQRETEAMLHRLGECLAQHHAIGNTDYNTPRRDAEALRRISMTLHNWHELEYGIESVLHASWIITRGKKVPGPATYTCTQCGHKGDGAGNCEACGDVAPIRKTPRVFEHDENGKPYMETHHYQGADNYVTYTPIPDREAGALKRLKKIMARYPALQAYVQGDPRGCALYILRPGDVPEGATVDSCYSRGIAVYR